MNLRHKKIASLNLSLILLVVLAFGAVSGVSYADPPPATTAYNAICAKLKSINKTTYNTDCAGNVKEADIPGHAAAICTKYAKQLKTQCANYKAATTPQGKAVGSGSSSVVTTSSPTGPPHCGDKPSVQTSINFGCKGKGNPIADAAFAIIRFLSNGVGLVIVASIIVGGIQYSASRDDPQAVAVAVNRIRSSLIALIIFIFSYAILNYLIPKGFLN